jgi:hypothetical protein
VSADDRDRVVRDLRPRRDIGDDLADRTPERRLPVVSSLDLVALFVAGAMMPPT